MLHVTCFWWVDKKNTNEAGVNDGILLSAAAATALSRKPLRHAAATAATAGAGAEVVAMKCYGSLWWCSEPFAG